MGPKYGTALLEIHIIGRNRMIIPAFWVSVQRNLARWKTPGVLGGRCVIGEAVKGQQVMLAGPWRPPLPVLQADCNLLTPLQGKSGLEEHCEV